MLTADQIRSIARKEELPAGVIEKDYSIHWLLYGIYSVESKVKDSFVFKGGTAIRKVYFPETWRLSEDLDFTVFDIKSDKIKAELPKIFDFLFTTAGITFSLKSFHQTNNSIIGNIQYIGSLGAKNRIRIDISLDEKLVIEPVERKVKAKYDVPEFEVKIYSLDEILIEKLRSIIQRGKSRDYYDVWRLLKEKEFDLAEIKNLLIKKCEINDIEYDPGLFFNEKRLNETKGYWVRGLGYLTKNLPPFDIVISELKEYLKPLAE